MALGGTPMGIGVDGEVRVSACEAGVVAFKPTSTNVTRLGVKRTHSQLSHELIPTSPCPIAKVTYAFLCFNPFNVNEIH